MTLSTDGGDGALLDQDYGSLDASFSFAAGQTDLIVPLQIIDDAQNETLETIGLTLSQPDGLEIDQTQYEITIIDNDAPPVLTINGPENLQESSPQPLTLTLTLSEISGQDIDLSLELNSLSGTETDLSTTSDFIRIPRGLSIPAGTAEIQLVLQPVDDDLFERVEDFQLTLTPIKSA